MDTVAGMVDPPPRSAVHGTRSTLVLSGDVDASAAPPLETRMRELSTVDRLDLDMSAVTFMDSSGLRVVLAEHRRRCDTGQELVLQRPSHTVRRLLEITGLVPHLRVESLPIT